MTIKSILTLAVVSYLYSSPSPAQNVDELGERSAWTNNYQHSLAEEMLDEGRLKLEQGQYAEAERLFFDALQVVKINNGMNSTLQIPVLELLIQSQLPQRQWGTIKQYLAYFDWLTGEFYRTDLNDFLNSTKVLSALYLQASADHTNPHSAHFLIASKNLNWNAISAIEGVYCRESKQLTPWLYQVVLSHFYQSSLIKRRGLTSYNYKTDEPAIVNGWSLSKNESLRKSYNIGLELLQRIREIEAAGDSKEAEAIASLYLGDWEATFDNGPKAIEHYKTANQLFLAGCTQQESVDALFAQTSVLPEPGFKSSLAELITKPFKPGSAKEFIAWSANYPGAAAPPAIQQFPATDQEAIQASVSFDYNLGNVTEYMGYKEVDRSWFTKSNITLVSISDDSQGAVSQALRDVSLIHLRPQLRSGELVSSEDITINYLFSRQTAPLLLTDN